MIVYRSTGIAGCQCVCRKGVGHDPTAMRCHLGGRGGRKARDLTCLFSCDCEIIRLPNAACDIEVIAKVRLQINCSPCAALSSQCMTKPGTQPPRQVFCSAVVLPLEASRRPFPLLQIRYAACVSWAGILNLVCFRNPARSRHLACLFFSFLTRWGSNP